MKKQSSFLKMLAVVSFVPTMLFAQAPAVVGTPLGPANVNLTPSAASVGQASTFSVDVNVDLTGRTGRCAAATVPVALGAFTIPVSFDTTRVQLTSVASCGGAFGVPSSSSVATANTSGRVVITGSQSNAANTAGAVTGNVCVARLQFTSTATGSGSAAFSTIQGAGPTAISLGSSGCSPVDPAAPATITGTGTNATVTVNAPVIPPQPVVTQVPTLSEYALMALAASLAFVALFAMKRG